ncbi:hypothetical protein BOSEA31B_10433 [Hyphomicrobiales bacterium]|nr:hypothetical protein BOSEA31B_10433 [Hyphomicrobiales bacterium]CAH1702115.1 hypothetical protein BOSEA1005_21814 [Hyphomicrobiales bacterium]CAI0346272.1 hypothetical protein BO1005MUT1_490084 [Hyphomicrobiales bacterium]
MIRFHLGRTELPGCLRFNSGRSYFTLGNKRHATTHFVINPLRHVVGVSWKAKWFFGVMTFEGQTYERPVSVEDAKLDAAHD